MQISRPRHNYSLGHCQHKTTIMEDYYMDCGKEARCGRIHTTTSLVHDNVQYLIDIYSLILPLLDTETERNWEQSRQSGVVTWDDRILLNWSMKLSASASDTVKVAHYKSSVCLQSLIIPYTLWLSLERHLTLPREQMSQYVHIVKARMQLLSIRTLAKSFSTERESGGHGEALRLNNLQWGSSVVWLVSFQTE